MLGGWWRERRKERERRKGERRKGERREKERDGFWREFFLHLVIEKKRIIERVYS